MLRDFGALRTALGTLGAASACVDIAAVVDQRLPAHAPTRPVRQRHRWHWQLLPAGFAAAGMLVTGAYLGMLLEDGAAIGAGRLPAVAVFDPVPPGGLCVPPVCYGRGR